MKKIGNTIYVHITNVGCLPKELKDMVGLGLIRIDETFFNKIAIVKVDKKNNKVTFIQSKDWDTAREPEVGDAICVDIATKQQKIIKAKGQIYHHKWMFVDEGYRGFDIEESKRWSEKWQSVIPSDRTIKSRIGYKKYWDEYLKQYNLEVE